MFRDGLAGVFTFGGVLAAGVYGFTDDDVILFGVAANVVAAASPPSPSARSTTGWGPSG